MNQTNNNIYQQWCNHAYQPNLIVVQWLVLHGSITLLMGHDLVSNGSTSNHQRSDGRRFGHAFSASEITSSRDRKDFAEWRCEDVRSQGWNQPMNLEIHPNSRLQCWSVASLHWVAKHHHAPGAIFTSHTLLFRCRRVPVEEHLVPEVPSCCGLSPRGLAKQQSHHCQVLLLSTPPGLKP